MAIQRRTNHDHKYSHLESEVSGLKTDVSSLKIDMSGVRADVRVLGESYHALERTVVAGFDDIKAAMRDTAEAPSSIKTNTLIAIIGVVLPTLGMIGTIIWLLLTPVQEAIQENRKAVDNLKVNEHQTIKDLSGITTDMQWFKELGKKK